MLILVVLLEIPIHGYGFGRDTLNDLFHPFLLKWCCRCGVEREHVFSLKGSRIEFKRNIYMYIWVYIMCTKREEIGFGKCLFPLAREPYIIMNENGTGVTNNMSQGLWFFISLVLVCFYCRYIYVIRAIIYITIILIEVANKPLNKIKNKLYKWNWKNIREYFFLKYLNYRVFVL